MKRLKGCFLGHGILLLLMGVLWSPSWKGSSLADAAGKHSFRIKVTYGAGLDQNTGNPSAIQRLTKRVLVPAATSWLEKALKVPDVADSTIRVQRNCPNKHHLINGLRYCVGSCTSVTKCGEATVPVSHLERCRTCDDDKQTNCRATGPTNPGVTGHDLILYVTAVSTFTCSNDSAISHSLHCQQEKKLDRPIVGNLNICPNRVSYLNKDYAWQVQYIIHDLFHVLAFSPQLYGFYRDSKGAPLTPRDQSTNLPPRTGNLFSWSDKVITFKPITDWEVYNGKVNRHIAYMVTPKVKTAVQNHFNCFSSQLEGAPMELQKWPYYHWENRLFHGEILSGELGTYLVISTITLAGLEDTGWYTADYSYAQTYTWGKGLGCDFATKSCLGFMKSQKKNGQPITPFCETKPTLGQVTCSSDRRSVVKCNLVNHTRSIPSEYQYFTGTSGFTDKSGGKDLLADYCPYYQEFSVNQEKDSRCYIKGNQPTDNIALESYGSSSVCVNHGARRWTKDGKATSLTMAGAGCYKISCAANQVVKIEINGKLYDCPRKNKQVVVAEVVNGVKYMGSIRCPGFDDVCKEYYQCPSDCSHQGHCVQGVCFCDPGYSGTDCSSRYFEDLKDCKSYPCLNQGTCSDTAQGYNCTCPIGTSGKDCEINRDECLSNPCQNGAICVDGLNSYTCICKVGYEGVFCEKDTKECSSAPCLNGGKCMESGSRYICHCAKGFFGSNCQQRVTQCPICFNGGTCRQDNSGVCDCPIGYGGPLCLSRVDYCDSNPCVNGGTCSEIQGGFSCSCLSGYTGHQCETAIVLCSSGLCQNGGTCTNRPSGYQCTCRNGFTGDKCEVNIDECSSTPCWNGATCDDGDSRFNCRCVVGYTGTFCEINIDECESDPCLNNGNCLDHVNSFQCICQPGYSRTLCGQNIDDCPSEPCQNGGTCVDKVNSYGCLCPPGYSGVHCESEVNECASNPCLNSGTCVDGEAGFRCDCISSYTGQVCEYEVDECKSSPCENGGKCRDWIGNYTCTCPVGFTGVHCEVDNNDCLFQPCRNGGTCHDKINSYTCQCPPDYTGLHCETIVAVVVVPDNPCDSGPCKHSGTCNITGGMHFLCFCSPGFSGLLCESEIDNCLSSPCPHGSQCSSHRFGYSCNECASSPCLNDGQCIDKQQGFDCQCPVGFSGARCEIDLNECDLMPCVNGGRCIDGAGRYTCICTSGYEGINCEKDTDECLSQPCMSNGICVDYVDSYTCICGAGYAGEHCEIMQQDCQKLPCLNGGTCMSGGGIQYCGCLQQYTGSRCEIDLLVNECMSNPCLNGGSCIDQAGAFHCDCHHGFQGVQCEENINDCVDHHCQNGGQCVDGVNLYSCVCPRRYTGQFCTIVVDPCEANPCKNGGTCIGEGFKDFNCLCPRGYWGKNCEGVVTSACLSVNCRNSGTCVERQGIAVCVCKSGYSGKLCEHQDSPCASSPCFNGGTCQRELNSFEGYECLCTDLFIGSRCEKKRSVCNSNPCKNGGVCLEDTENGIISLFCQCQFGYMGSLCQHTLTACKPNPCRNKGICRLGVYSGFHCMCPFPYTGSSCLSEIKIPSFGPSSSLFLNPLLRNAGSAFGLEFSFNPQSTDGLLLSSSDEHSNHIAVGLSNGRVEYQYNYGAGQNRLLSDDPVSLGEWHTIRLIHSTNKEGLHVDNQKSVHKVSSRGTSIGFNSSLVFGYQSSKTSTGFYKGFTGCVSNLAINSYPIKLDSNSVLGSHYLDSCLLDNQCDRLDLLCLNSGTCIHTPDGPVCACQHGYTGRRCEHSSLFVLPFFSGGSYIEAEVPSVSGDAFQISVTFQTSQQHGLLLYMSEFADGSGDFVVVYLTGGQVVFGFDGGSGPGWLHSSRPLQLHQYNKITISKQGQFGDLSVNSVEWVTGQSQGPFATASLRPAIYVGGLPLSVSLPAALSAELTSSGYVGCIIDFTVNGKRLDLSSNNLDSHFVDIQDCAVQSPSRLLPAFTTPSFSGNGYLEYKLTPRSPTYNEWKIEFRPTAPDGIIFFVGQLNTTRPRYLYLQLSGGYAQVKFDFGDGEGNVTNTEPLRVSMWHMLTVSRTSNVVVLIVNNQQQSGTVSGSKTTVVSYDSFFLGGLPSGSNLPISSGGFSGCVRSVQLDGSTVLSLPLRAVDGRAVTECSAVDNLR